MHLANYILWKSIGFLVFVLIFLQACSGDVSGSDPTQTIGDENRSCQDNRQYFEQFVTDNYDKVRVSLGGRLYDKWWIELRKSAPVIDHGLWATRATDANGTPINTRSGADSWRCKECHSWDYKGRDGVYNIDSSHYTNFSGITLATNDSNIDLFCKIRDGVGIDSRHKFNVKNTSGVLTDLAILALTKFVREGQVEVNNFINMATGEGVGDPIAGELVFTYANPKSCSNSTCHGIDGTANFGFSLQTRSLTDPWKVLHKIRFSHPGSFMPAFIENISESDINNVLRFIQTLEPNCIKDNTTFVNTQLNSTTPWDGGRLYDQWWDGMGTPAPSSTHPLWSSQSSNLLTGADTWRCNECHGWDYKGKDGAYNVNSSHYTGFNGILNAKSKTPVKVFCAISEGLDVDKQHIFLKTVQNPQGLSQTQILELTHFITASGSATNNNGLVDASDYITVTGQARGDATNGENIYLNNPEACQTCHGIDGTVGFAASINLGTLAFENPWEVLHKIRYGHPNSIIPSYIQDSTTYELTDQEIKDVLTYSQTLN